MRASAALLAIAALSHPGLLPGGAALAADASRPATAAPAQPATAAGRAFTSPDEAATALVTAVRAVDKPALLAIFGPAAEPLVNSGDPVEDANAAAEFAKSFDEAHRFDQKDNVATLIIGKEDWPFPIPLKRDGDQWRFDTAAGAEEVLNRRIGRNEDATIKTMLAYVDAQIEYAEMQEAAGNATAAYAQRLLSSPGKQDGLYWPAAQGQPDSPLGPLIAGARAEGYAPSKSGERIPYHGYYFKILTGQGPDALGGAADYIVNGRMIGGFGLIAWPARYGDSGIVTFVVNHQGVVHQKDLGPNSSSLAVATTRYNPDSSWTKADQ